MFDANAVVSAALKAESVPEQALLLALQQAQIWLSPLVDAEIRDVFDRRKLKKAISPERRLEILGLLEKNARFVEPVERVVVCSDPDDDMYLDLASAADASFLVSGDNDLLQLDPWRGIRIVNPAVFIRLWGPSPA